MVSRMKTDNALIYTTCLFDANGDMHPVSHIYEMAISTRLKTIENLLSYNEGYTLSPILDIQLTKKIAPIVLATENNRKIYATAGQEILTRDGFVKVGQLGIKTELKVLDNFIPTYRQYGYKKFSQGKYRVAAFLKAHAIPFEEVEDGIITDRYEIYCVQYDTDAPSIKGNIVTLGLNNYRKFLMDEYEKGEYSYDKIVKMTQFKQLKYAMSLQVGGDKNYVTHSGAIFRTNRD